MKKLRNFLDVFGATLLFMVIGAIIMGSVTFLGVGVHKMINSYGNCVCVEKLENVYE